MLVDVDRDRGVVLRFAGCELDHERFELRRNGDPQRLEPQAFDVLACLARHHDRVVTREELLDTVWGDRFVSASALSSRIKDARRAVGDDGERQAVIKTVHGRGFRLVAEVEEVTTGDRSEVGAALPGRPLRRPASTFVGRDDEIAALVDVAARSRLLSLCGPGGIGKTRLALELAGRIADRYPDGVRLLELAELPEDADVVAAVAAATGVQHRPGTDLAERVVEPLGGRRLLLVVDNCEHVTEGAAAFVRHAIEATDGIHVIATARHPLHVDGEQVWPVAPLASSGGRSPAVRLFLDRASALAPTDWIDELDQELVHRVCQRVDGVPLCIELAASRARHIGLAALLDELVDAIPLRGVGRSDRHHSVESVIAWTYDRLPPSQQGLFERVAVFAGEFDADAVANLADPGSGAAVLDDLSELVDQSMVAVDHHRGVATYRLLAPLRDFGRRRIGGSEAVATDVHRRHAGWVLQQSMAADRALRGPDAAAAIARLEALVPEVLLARRTIAEDGDRDSAEALAQALFWFGQEQGRIELLRPTAPDDDDPSTIHASAAVAAWQLGDVDTASKHAERAIATATGPVSAGIARLARAEVCQLLGDHTCAIQLAEEISALAEQANDPLLATVAHVAAALSSAAIGEAAAAIGSAQVASEIADRAGSPLAHAWAEYAQGESRLEQDPAEALVHLRTAWALARSAGGRLLAGVAGLSYVSLRARTSDDADSLAGFGELIDHWAKAGTAVHQWATIRNLVHVLAQRGADEDAARLHGALSVGGRGAAPAGAEAERLAAAMASVQDRLGLLRFSELVADGGGLSDADVVARARSTCSP